MGSIRVGRKWQCPGHGLVGEHSQSLALDVRDGKVLMFCHAGCGLDKILAGMRLPFAALRTPMLLPPASWHEVMLAGRRFPPPRAIGHGSLQDRGYRFESEHPYGDPAWAWKVRYRHHSGAKEVRWESRNPHGLRVEGLLGRREVEMPLYCVREVRMAVALDEPVLLVESESSVDALKGWYATTWAGGAGSVHVATISSALAGYDRLVVIPDNDTAGLGALETLRQSGLAPHVLMPAQGEDARDLYSRVGNDAFTTMIEGTFR